MEAEVQKQLAILYYIYYSEYHLMTLYTNCLIHLNITTKY